jgi:Uma2 family endonuclease
MNDATVLPARHKLDVDTYYWMAEAGIFGRNDRIELINGDLIDMAPIGQGHDAIVNGLNEALVLACSGRAIVSPKNSIRLNRTNAPQPDFTILQRRPDFYASGERPGPADVLLMVEVADTSLRFDRKVKLRLYARAGIGEYWIVNLQRRMVEAYKTPSDDEYSRMNKYKPGDCVGLTLASDIIVKLDLIFG